jgi:lysophospholipase L1-like esterase
MQTPRPSWIALCLAFLACGQLPASTVYLALGESTGFGIDLSTPASLTPSFGDQGYVRPFADTLASKNGGVRPTVLNLSIPGELSTSFFDATSPPGWTSRLPVLNLNYPDPAIPQHDRMIASVASIHAAGNSIGYITFVIGANDIFYVIAQPGFQGATQADQAAMIAATLGTIQSKYVAVLGELKALAPEAKILLPGYYNPFPAGLPEHVFYDSVLAGFNPLVKADAAAFGAAFVDVYPSFTGNELAFTNIGIGDFHPTQAGYAAIAGALAQAVPEPASVFMHSIGLAVVVGLAWRRRA